MDDAAKLVQWVEMSTICGLIVRYCALQHGDETGTG
jgi:hypothetical protein